MGKSTVAGYFAKEGAAVWDADNAVHRLYQYGAQGYLAIQHLIPDAVDENGVNRDRLSAAIRSNPDLLGKIEGVIHPLVAEDRSFFKAEAESHFVVFDIPLLFEGGLEKEFDTIVVVSAGVDIQRSRVLARPGMTPEKFEFILSQQMPDAEKRARADFIIETGTSFEDTRQQVKDVLKDIQKHDP